MIFSFALGAYEIKTFAGESARKTNVVHFASCSYFTIMDYDIENVKFDKGRTSEGIQAFKTHFMVAVKTRIYYFFE